MSDIQDTRQVNTQNQHNRAEGALVGADALKALSATGAQESALLVVDKNRPGLGVVLANLEHVEIHPMFSSLFIEWYETTRRQNGQQTATTRSHPGGRKVRLPREVAKAMALALRALNPDWSNQQVAEVVGYSVRQLLRWKEYARLSKGGEGKGRLPRGTKDRGTGTVEAWSDDIDNE
jgi:hypothetical protein